MDQLEQALAPKSDQLNADDLMGKTITIKVRDVRIKSGEQQPIDIFYENDKGKPYRPCKNMGRLLGFFWGGMGDNFKHWIGRSMTLYRDPEVTFAKIKMGGIRISHISNIDGPKEFVYTKSKGVRIPYIVQPLVLPKQEPASVDQKFIEAGEENASKGVEAYTAWLATLSPEEKQSIRPHHSEWSKMAKAHTSEREIKNGAR